MTKSYAQLKSAIAKLEKEAAALREAEMTKVIAQIKESIATFGLTVEHLFGRGAKALKVAAGKTLGDGKAPRKGAGIPKYRHPETGKTWTGFGKAPGWIATARNRDKFLIAPSGVAAASSVEGVDAPVAAVAKTTRKARLVAPAKKSIRAKKAAPRKSAPLKKAAPARKAAAAPKAPKAAAKTRRPRASTKSSAPVSPAAPAETTASAS